MKLTIGTKIIGFSLLFVVCLTLGSCGFLSSKPGVLLWSPDEKLISSGTVIAIRKESKLTETYTITASGLRERLDLPFWRVSVFKSKKEAASFSESVKPYAGLWAVPNRDGLPVREQPDSASDRVYRLKEKQLIKVLGKSKEKSTEGNFSDYWYKILTDDGAQGWVFGYALELSARSPSEGVGEIPIGKPASEDAALDVFLSKTWRPEYFRTLIDEGTIDLARFKPEYGLFIETGSRVVKLVTRKQNLTFNYTAIERAVGNMYIFDGTSLQVNLVTEDRISVQYVAKDRTVSEVYVGIEEDVEDIIKGEQDRRQSLFDQILAKGKEFNSSAYGTITLTDKSEFTWHNYDLLVPDIIPQTSAQNGTVTFDVLLPKDLRGNHAGALSFVFKGVKDPVYFLYSLTPDGFKLVALPKDLVDENVVKQAPSFPIVIAFTGLR